MADRFSPFPAEFEQALVALIVRSPKFAAIVHPIVLPEMFSSQWEPIIKAFIDNYKKSGKLLDRVALRQASKSHLVNDLWRTKFTQKRTDYYVEQLETYARSYQFEQALLAGAGMLDKQAKGEQVNLDALQTRFKAVFEMGVVRDFGIDYFARLKERLTTVKDYSKNRLPTGFPLLDMKMDGGLDVGELLIILAGSNVGKSQLAHNFAVGAMMRGKHILHMTMEMSPRQVEMRYDMRLAKLTKDALRMNPKEAFRRILAVKKMYDCKLMVQDYRSIKLNPNALRSMLHQYVPAHGHPDILVIDYPDLMVADVTTKERRLDIADIYKELRRIGNEFETRVIAPTQANRTSYGEEITELEHMSESLDKAMIADFVFAMCQTRAESGKNELRLNIAKNREGERNDIIKCRTDYARAAIEEAGR